MYPINEKKILHKFKYQRILSGRDLFRHLGERIPTDRGFMSSRHPSSRQDMAMEYVLDGYSHLQEKEIEKVPDDIPPASDPDDSE